MEIVQSNVAVEQNLEDAGCTKNFIKHYLSLHDHGKEKEQRKQTGGM